MRSTRCVMPELFRGERNKKASHSVKAARSLDTETFLCGISALHKRLVLRLDAFSKREAVAT
jgi:hypothetical protein